MSISHSLCYYKPELVMYFTPDHQPVRQTSLSTWQEILNGKMKLTPRCDLHVRSDWFTDDLTRLRDCTIFPRVVCLLRILSDVYIHTPLLSGCVYIYRPPGLHARLITIGDQISCYISNKFAVSGYACENKVYYSNSCFSSVGVVSKEMGWNMFQYRNTR